ncbi:AaceriACR169Cp [[Ashbya] aceris (nom. inval.)]|nr:AaceriACR169Cp [[Ashbya] aceris (nom. inval.)]
MDIENTRLVEFLLTDEAYSASAKGNRAHRSTFTSTGTSEPQKRPSSVLIQNLFKVPKKNSKNDDYIKKGLESIIVQTGTSDRVVTPAGPTNRNQHISSEGQDDKTRTPLRAPRKSKRHKRKAASKNEDGSSKAALEAEAVPEAEAAPGKRPRKRKPRKQRGSGDGANGSTPNSRSARPGAHITPN